jgi:hypothetical protein
VGFELTTLVVIGTDCIGSYKYNYHMIMTITAILSLEVVSVPAPNKSNTTASRLSSKLKKRE